MKRIVAALGNHLYLAARCAIEIGSLVAGSDFELFDALDRSWDDAGGSAASGSGAAIAVPRRIGGVAARHIIAIIAAVQLKAVLVGSGARNVPGRRHAHLQHRERGGIASQVGQ